VSKLLSILIPTKERPTTLEKCLLSCARVQFDDIEFVVLDNASTDHTARICQPFLSDPRFRYIRHDTRGSINDQFYRAVGASDGEWMCIIGDDDAVLPAGLRYFVNELMSKQPLFADVEVVRWPDAIYRWPDFDGTEANLLVFSSLQGGISRGNIRNSSDMIPACAKNIKFTYQAPGIYHNFIKRRCVNYLLENYPNTIFFLSPDISIRVHCMYESLPYLELPRPLTLAGYSSNSTGASIGGGDKSKVRQTFWSENIESIELLSSATGIDFSEFGSNPPCSEVLITYAIFCRITKDRGKPTPLLKSYIISEILNAKKLSPSLRQGVKALLQRILESNNQTADLSAFDNSLPSRSLSEPNFVLSQQNGQYRYTACLRLPSHLVSDANQASLFLETIHSSLEEFKILP